MLMWRVKRDETDRKEAGRVNKTAGNISKFVNLTMRPGSICGSWHLCSFMFIDKQVGGLLKGTLGPLESTLPQMFTPGITVNYLIHNDSLSLVFYHSIGHSDSMLCVLY